MQNTCGFKRRLVITLISIIWMLLTLIPGNIIKAAVDEETFVENKPKILFVSWRNYGLHPSYERQLIDLGYIVEKCRYADIARKKLSYYNVIVLQLLPRVGEEPLFTAEQNKLLYQFMREGGGLLFFPFSEKYTLPETLKLVNSFLNPLEAKVLYERVEDKKQVEIKYTLGEFRYCSTDNIKKHPATEGVKQIWYPLGGIRKAPTFTMKVSDEWDIIVSGAKSASSESYPSSPPIVAAREFGKGRIVVFCSHPLYWLVDCYHRTFSEGFILKEGDGFKLLTNIYDWLAEPSIKSGRVFAKSAEEKKDQEEVQYWPIKEEWIKYVQKAVMPKGYGVKYYVDCGDEGSDLEYTKERGYGYISLNGTHMVTWRGSLQVHATGGSVNMGNKDKVIYRFSGLNPEKKYLLGLLWWDYDNTIRRGSVFIDSVQIMDNVSLPSYKKGEIPEVKILEIPRGEYKDGSIDILIKRGQGVSLIVGINVGELWIFEEGLKKGVKKDVNVEEAIKRRIKLIKSIPVHKGIIGVHSAISSGQNTVAEFCQKAKDAGYSYLVFTEDFGQMTSEKWEELKTKCKEETTVDFIAIPGIDVTIKGMTAFCFGFKAFPEYIDNWYHFLNKMLFKHKASIILTHPHTAEWLSYSKHKPFVYKFYTGIEVFAYDNRSKLMGDWEDMYRSLTTSGYGVVVSAGHRIYDLKGLEEAEEGYRTYIWAKSISDIPYNFRRRMAFISSGPIIERFTAVTKDGRDINRWAQGEKIAISIEVSSSYPIKEVIIFKGKEVFRRFKPKRTKFSAIVWEVRDRKGTFTLKVIDEKNRKAISGPIMTANDTFKYSMCADQQNNYIVLYKQGGPEVCLGQWDMGWRNSRLSTPTPAAEFTPKTWETGRVAAVTSFNTEPIFYISAGKPELDRMPIRTLLLSSPECIITKNYTVTEHTECTAKHIIFRPRFYGYNMVLVDMETKIKKDIILASKSNGMEIALFSVRSNKKFAYTHYSLVSSDIMKQKDILSDNVLKPCLKGGYAALWPFIGGSFGIFPLTGEKYWVSISNKHKSISMGRKMPGQTIPAGTTWRDKFLFVLDNGRTDDDSNFDRVRDLYGFDGSPAYKINLTHGKLINDIYGLTLEAENYYVSGSLASPELPNPLPLIVKGLNGNWPVGIYEEDTETLRRLGVYENTAYAVIDTPRQGQLFIGNLLICSEPEIKLSLLRIGEKFVELEAHNPTDKERSFTIKSPGPLKIIPALKQRCILKPGESRQFKFSKGGKNR